MLTFDEAAHAYFWNGQRVPNVTSILAPLVDYSRIPPGTLEVARQKGVAVHKMVELDCKGDLDEDGLPEWMRPVLTQWRLFVRESGFELFKSEYRVFHPRFKYAGTLDLYGAIRGKHCFIDVKRSFAAGPVIGLQLSAYEEAYEAQEGCPDALRYALRLNENGPYRLEQHADRSDFTTFLSLLTIYNFRRKHDL